MQFSVKEMWTTYEKYREAKTTTTFQTSLPNGAIQLARTACAAVSTSQRSSETNHGGKVAAAAKDGPSEFL